MNYYRVYGIMNYKLTTVTLVSFSRENAIILANTQLEVIQLVSQGMNTDKYSSPQIIKVDKAKDCREEPYCQNSIVKEYLRTRG